MEHNLSKFYTFVDTVGNRIAHRWIDSDGGRHKELTNEFPINFYLSSEEGQYKSISGEPLKRVQFKKIADAKAWCKKYDEVDGFKIYGNNDYVQQFLAHHYAVNEAPPISLLKIVSIDIEVEHRNGFPEPKYAANEIWSISMKIFGGKSITFGTKPEPKYKDSQYIRSDDEGEMLKSFMFAMRQIAPDFITGWNVQNFDITYLVNRITNVLGENAANGLSPFYGDTPMCIMDSYDKTTGEDTYKILGITVLDYLDLYKKFNPEKQESYRLDFIAEIEGVGRKVDYSEYGSLVNLYEQNWDLFCEYNDIDNRLVELLDEKLEFIAQAVSIAALTHSRYSDSMGTVKIWDNMIYHMALADGKQIPPKVRRAKESIVGGYVKSTIPGLYRWPVTFDLTSLYPSIVRLLNMSPDTLVSMPMGSGEEMIDKVFDGKVKPEDYTKDGSLCFAINGARFKKEPIGIITKAMGFVFDERKRVKDLMKDKKRELEKLKEQLAKL